MARGPREGCGLWGIKGDKRLSLEQCVCRSLYDQGQALREEALDKSLPLGAPSQAPSATQIQAQSPGLWCGTTTLQHRRGRIACWRPSLV